MKVALKVVGTVGLLLAAVVGGYRVYDYHYHQQQLTTELKRTLTAATDPSNNLADIRAYLHEAIAFFWRL
jgi:hypothetical protein